MKKKLFLLLLPLALSMVSCGKDVDPKVDKVDLSRLLDDGEISEVFKKVKDNFANKLVAFDANSVLIDDDLIDQRTETSTSGSAKIKGEEYAEIKAERVNKVKNNFYSYTTKMVMESKIAMFGKYVIELNETYNDNQKDKVDQTFDYYEVDDETIATASSSLPIDSTSLSDVTFGVDGLNNVYGVYSKETINTSEGRDKEGKDATFITKSTNELLIKLGNLKDPKLESYKIVSKRETNYDKELKIYKDYQLINSSVISYKCTYGNRGKNDGKDKFINSLPEKAIGAASVVTFRYRKDSSGYVAYDDNDLSVSRLRTNFNDNLFSYKANKMEFKRGFGYNFNASYQEITIDKGAQEIKTAIKQISSFSLNGSDDIEVYSTSVNGQNTQLLKLKDGLYTNNYDVEFYFDPTNGSMAVYAK